jgi:hypothetical protein
MTEQYASHQDRYVTDQLTNLLFPVNPYSFGEDLVSRNIQRGRDHGLPGYNQFREFCGLKPVCSWAQRPQEIDPQAWSILSRLYEKPGDIDLFSGGLSEIPVQGCVTGPTFTCIIARQFEALKFGDRS